MVSPDFATPDFWATVEQAFSSTASGVEQVFYQGTDENGRHKIGVVVYDLDNTACEVGCIVEGLNDKHGLDVILGDIRRATTARVLGRNCPTCGVPWPCCIKRYDHEPKARTAAARRI
jgi:hypothetical protein